MAWEILLELLKTRVYFCEQEKRSCFFFPRREANDVLNLAVRHFHRMARLLGLQQDQFL